MEHTCTMQRDYITVVLIRQTFSLMIAYFAHRKIKALQFVLEALTGVLDKTFIGWIRDIHPDLFIKSSLDEHRLQCLLNERRFHGHFTVGKLQGHSVKASLIWFHPNPILVWYLSTWITIHKCIYLSINIFIRIIVFKKVPLIEGFFQKLFFISCSLVHAYVTFKHFYELTTATISE